MTVTARPSRGSAPDPRRPIYEGSRIPEPIPTVLQVPRELKESGDILEINFGPNHPSTHGVLRLVLELAGEKVVGIQAVVGYLHTGFEKTMEQKTYWKGITYPERMDYLAFQNNELGFVLAVEKLLGIEVPERALWIRTLFDELTRIMNHLLNVTTFALDCGAMTPLLWMFEERETLMNIYEAVSGARMHANSTASAASTRTCRAASTSGSRPGWTSSSRGSTTWTSS